LASYALTAYQLFTRVTHPHFLPLISLMLLGCTAGIFAVASGLWRVIRGPSRLTAIGWLAFAIIPILLWAAHVSYALSAIRTANRPCDYRLKLAAVGAAAVTDGLTRLLYPNRLAGEHTVMIYGNCADPEADVAAMDRHIEQAGQVLGRPLPTTVHWVRGGLAGIPGVSFVGTAVCLAPDGTGVLSDNDRHEVAHNVLDDQLPVTACPPTVFYEGWAESQSGRTRVSRAQELWNLRSRESALSVRQLLSPEWYANGHIMVYLHGGMLVDFLVRRYGGDKFFRLCATCRPDTIADDCKEIYGVDLDELDELLWADVRDQAFSKDPARRKSISAELGLPLDGLNDESARLEFLHRYPNEVEKLKEAYRHVRISAKIDYSAAAATAGNSTGWTTELVCDGERAHLTNVYSTSSIIYVATPQRSFRLEKSPADARFRIVWVAMAPSSRQNAAIEQIRMRAPEIQLPYQNAATHLPEIDLLERMKLPGFTITRAVRAQAGSRRLIKIYFEFEMPGDDEPYREAGWFSFRVDECWALEAFEVRAKGITAANRREYPKDRWSELAALSNSQGTVRYRGNQKGIPVLESVEWNCTRAGKPQYTRTARVTDIQFGPAPDETFDLASFDADPPPNQGNSNMVAPTEDIFVRLTRWLVRAIWLSSAVVAFSVVRPLVRRAVTGKGEIVKAATGQEA
jgi:hypothetical protein